MSLLVKKLQSCGLPLRSDSTRSCRHCTGVTTLACEPEMALLSEKPPRPVSEVFLSADATDLTIPPPANSNWYRNPIVKRRTRRQLRKLSVDVEPMLAVNMTEMLVILPPELLLEIDGYLSDVDKLAIRACCRKVRAAMGSPKIDHKARVTFRHMLQRDNYPGYCIYERAGNMEDDRRLCCACLVDHPISQFWQEELWRGPEERVCIGKGGVFRMCQHTYLSFNEIQQIRVPDRFSFIECPDKSHDAENWTGRPWMVIGVGNKLDRLHDNTKCTREQLLFEITPDEHVTRDMITKALSNLDEPICPHINSNQLDLFEDLYSVECPIENGTFVCLREGDKHKPRWGNKRSCQAPGCDTTFWLRRRNAEYLEPPSVRLVSERILGSLDSEDEDKWRAQMSQPGVNYKRVPSVLHTNKK